MYATEAEARVAGLRIQNEDASYSTFHAGDVRFADLHADGVLDDKDKTVIGDPNPDFTGSWGNRFTMGRLLWTYSVRSNVAVIYTIINGRLWRACPVRSTRLRRS